MVEAPAYQFVLHNLQRQAYYFGLALLDSGGFGQVWSGVDSFGVPIAIKVIMPTGDVLRDFLSWHIEQDICLKSILHPNVITTYDQFVTPEGHLVLVMERAE